MTAFVKRDTLKQDMIGLTTNILGRAIYENAPQLKDRLDRAESEDMHLVERGAAHIRLSKSDYEVRVHHGSQKPQVSFNLRWLPMLAPALVATTRLPR